MRSNFFFFEGMRVWYTQCLIRLRTLTDPSAVRPADRTERNFLIEELKAASATGGKEATLKAFERFRVRAPKFAIRSDPAIRALIAVGLIDMAELITAEGLRKYPSDRDLSILHGEIARQRADWGEMARRFEATCKRFPRDVWPRVLQGIALRELGEFEQADKLLEMAISMEPHLASPRIEYARVAQSRGDVDEALRRWQALREHVGDEAGWVEAGRLMSLHGRHDDSVQLLTEGQARFDTRPSPTVELARALERSGRVSEAAAQWEILRNRVPQDPRGFVDGSRSLRALGRHNDAEAILERYVNRTNPHPTAVAEWAKSVQTSDPGEAARRWRRFRELFPDREEGYVSGTEALIALGKTAAAAELTSRWKAFVSQHSK